MSRKRCVVAMSGGVDSCVAAVLLKEQGYEVIGITMQLWDHAQSSAEGRFNSCCSLSDVHDARVTAHSLGVPHYVVNYEKEFRSGVVDYFAAEYAAGRTPNPCVLCNSKLKFDHLIDRARALGADKVATGHYARLVEGANGIELHKGRDRRKDQSYFLFDLKPDYLDNILFPLGDLTKPEVREIAARHGVHTAEKHESQEICFVAGKRYTDFLEEHYPQVTGKSGTIVDREGHVLGEHDGIHKFTVGQRKGLGNLRFKDAGEESKALYVAAIDAESGQVLVDDMDGLKVAAFEVAGVNWLGTAAQISPETVLSVAVRYRAEPVPCRVVALGERRYQVLLREPTRWVTPGQAAVFYDDERVMGGGFIGSPRNSRDDRGAAGRIRPVLEATSEA